MQSVSFWSQWYFQIPNFILAVVMYTMLGRALLGLFVDQDPKNYIWRGFCAITDPALALEREDWQERSAGQLHQALGSLDERARAIIEARWMAEEKATLQELADRFGISAERVRQIEQQALRALRAAVAG